MTFNKFTILVLLISSTALAAPELTLKCKMSPAGDFTATSKTINGFAKSQGPKVMAENILIPIASIDAGLSLRTKHMQEKYLEKNKYPEAKLIKAEGENGKGQGIIEIHGVQKPVSGTYKIEGDELIADFMVKLSDFQIAKVKYLGVGVNDEVKVTIRVPLKK